MKTTYTISPQTLKAVARLRELQVARQQVAELKEYGRVSTKSYESEQAAVEFRNGTSHFFTLPVRKIAEWVASSPVATLQLELGVNSGHGIRLSASFLGGTSEAMFLAASCEPESTAIITVDATANTEYQLAGQAADETELNDLKKKLAVVRKAAATTKEQVAALKKYNEAFRALRGAANRVAEARQYLAANSLESAVATAKQLRDAKRIARHWTAAFKHYSPEIPAGLPLTAEDKSWLTKWASEYAVADKRGWHVKQFRIAMLSVNLLVEAAAQCIRDRFPVLAESVHVNRIHEKFPLRSAEVAVYEYDHRKYTESRRIIRNWPAERDELSLPFKMALARLRRAEGKQ